MMLEWLGERHDLPDSSAAGRRLTAAVESAFQNDRLKPFELGGGDGTAAITAAVLGAAGAHGRPGRRLIMTGQLRVAVAGSGYFSQFHYDAWQRLDRAKLIALASHDVSTARERAAAFGVKAVFQDVETLLDSVEIDLLDIVTPPETHLAIVSAAAARGLPVVCQKPLAPTLAEAEEIVRIAGTGGITLAVHENFRFQPWFCHARQMITEGRLGSLHGIAFRLRPGDGQGPRAYLGRQPYFQTMARFLIHETGIHFVDTFRSLMGEVTAVTAPAAPAQIRQSRARMPVWSSLSSKAAQAACSTATA